MMTHRLSHALLFTAALAASAGCASSDTRPERGDSSGGPSGGSSANAGSPATAPQGTAGELGAGGSPGSSGAPASAGGQAAVAGSTSPSAGRPSYGGTASTGNGGSPAAGAAPVGGGTSTSGTPGPAAPSAGCGKATSLVSGRASIDVSGKMREYILALPSDYDPSHPYRLIFGWHPWGGSAQQVASGGYYGLQNQAKGSAIFVAGEGLDFGGNGKGWGNENGQDIALLNAMLDRFLSQLCIDQNRIFSTGFSFGGMFSFAAGCSPTGKMRAIAPMAGNTSVAGCQSGGGPVALMGFHGTDDEVVAIDGGRKGRDAFVQRNKCSMQTMPAPTTWCNSAGQTFQPCSCVSYQGCQDGYPVIWCEYKGKHMAAPNSAAALWSFFSQF